MRFIKRLTDKNNKGSCLSFFDLQEIDINYFKQQKILQTKKPVKFISFLLK